MTSVRTTCPYCGVGCGIAVTNGTLRSDADHPANFGRVCSKGAALKDTLELPDRLQYPTIHGREATWEEALDRVADEFTRVIRQHGPDAAAFYVSGQFLTEDYYVANKLMKGFIGSANIDTNSRLCMASSVAGHIRAFGEDVVPGCYEDLETADLAVLVGSNMAWCHPVLHQRLIAAREKRGTKIVNIDPRRTATCEMSDLHLTIAPGTDVLLFNGLLCYLAETDALNRSWITQHVSGFDESLRAAQQSAPSPSFVAEGIGVAPQTLLQFYELFARNERVVTLYSQGVNQSAIGTDKVNAIINCHLATGRIGRPGMGPFSLTGQPNAMGGREVGGLANQLAAHMVFARADVDRVRRFWDAPNIAAKPGLKAVDLFRRVRDGQIKALWIAATNPAASMPHANEVRDALETCPFVVVSDAWPTDTTARADVVLPAAAWGEKDGTVTNSERRISRQRAFRSPPGAARPDWWMFAEVARRMGWKKHFAYSGPASIFREHAALSAFENGGKRMFDIGALAACDDAAYDGWEPVQWPCPKHGPRRTRLFGDGQFPTPDGRARMVPICTATADHTPDLSLTLNTGRIRDQWHTMTRTGRVPHLMTHTGEPQLAIHPSDAARRGLTHEGFARIRSGQGTSIMRVEITEAQRRGEVFAPMHWTDHFSSAGAIARLVHNKTDAVSGQPDLKKTPVLVSAVEMAWTGLLLRRLPDTPDLGDDVYWAKTPLESGYAFHLAGWTELHTVIHSEIILRRLLQIPAEAELISYSDPKKAVFRYAGLVGDRLEACLFLAPAGMMLPSREPLALFLGRTLEPAERFSLLAGQIQQGIASPGKIVCACFSVGPDKLASEILKKNLRSVEEIGSVLRAGTNCGSCIPELKKILEDTHSHALNAAT